MMLRFFMWFYFVVCSVVASQKNAALSEHQVWTVRYKVSPETKVKKRFMQLESDGKVDVFTSNEKETTFSVHQMYKNEVDSFLNSVNLSYNVDVLDLQEFLQKTEREEFERKLKTRRVTKRSTKLCAPFDDEYMSFDEIELYLSCISKLFPSRVTKTSIGKTEENRDIWMMTVKSKKYKPRRAVFIIGGTHAREWISPSVTLFTLHKLITSTPKEVDGFEFKIVPVLNPDGYVYTFTTNRLWRKNKSGYLGSGECFGVDLNRNYNFRWGGNGSSSNTCSYIYRGPFAFSEKETKALAVQMKNTSNLKMVIDIHSFSQLVLYPWAFSSKPIDESDRKDMISMGNTFAKAALRENNIRYKVKNAAGGLYAASGVSMDYSYGTLGIKYSYVIELRDEGKFGFILPAEQIRPTQNEVYIGIKAMVNKLRKA